MFVNPRPTYIALVFISTAACLYSFFKPGIASPPYPSPLLNKVFVTNQPLHTSTLIKDLKQDSSDRKLSQLYQYKFSDGSELLSLMVRVRKRDDFKIETYGLLTKGIDSIYIKSPMFNPDVPSSMQGYIANRLALQTCVIPGSTRLDQANVQLIPLLDLIDQANRYNRSPLSKLIGIADQSDYACLVLTYFPSNTNQSHKVTRDQWSSFIARAQLALSDYPPTTSAKIHP